MAAIRGDRSVKELAGCYGIHQNLVRGWKRHLLAKAGAVFMPGGRSTKLESLLLENRDLRERERRFLLFMGRLSRGRIPTRRATRLLAGRLPQDHLDALALHADGPSRSRRLRSQIVIFHVCGVPNPLIAKFLGVYVKTVAKYVLRYERGGVASLFTPRVGVRKLDDHRYRDMVFAVLHSPPGDHGFNRTTWRRRDIHTVATRLGMPIGRNYIDRIIRDAGYRFRKARTVLTSNDPDYRAKVDHIHAILGRLRRTQRFFSIDEFGPFAVKRQGGRRWVGPGETPTVPQFQVSKGCLIVTAALELSSNHVTHFYSTGKNTAEMLKLLDVLLAQCRGCSKVYLSWDAAGWHASKSFLAQVAEVNTRRYRRANGTPAVDLAPLPARAQFLNVIESVFNGLARSVIHNSDYASADEAQAAIDRYFAERNAFFQANPQRAGGMIWGKERVPNAFREDQNCKNPRYR